jgi:hypothetical protein
MMELWIYRTLTAAAIKRYLIHSNIVMFCRTNYFCAFTSGVVFMTIKGLAGKSNIGNEDGKDYKFFHQKLRFWISQVIREEIGRSLKAYEIFPSLASIMGMLKIYDKIAP